MVTTGLPTFDSAITFLEAERATLVARIEKIDLAIESLRFVAGHEADPAPKAKARHTRPRASRVASGVAPRPTQASPIRARILAALKTAGEPMPNRALAATVGLSVQALNHHLQRLIADKQIRCEGVSHRRRVVLL